MSRPTSSPRRWLSAVGVLLAASSADAEPTARFPGSPRRAAQPSPVHTRPAAPEEPWATRSARTLVERAAAHEQRGDSAQALRAYTDAIQMDPSHGPAYLGLGRLREAMGDLVEAERAYREASRIGATAADALARLAGLRRGLGRRDEALADLQASVELDPRASARVRTLATWFTEAGAWPAALALWRRLLDAAESGDAAVDRDQARVQVRALELLAGETDPVAAGASHPAWERRALRAIARRRTAAP